MPTIGNFRVSAEEYQRINEFATRSGLPLSKIYKDAILQYIDQEEQTDDDAYFLRRLKERDRDLVEALKSMENRFAVLLVRLGIDMESLYALSWSLTSGRPDRTAMFEKCYAVGVERFRRKLSDLQRDMADSIQHQEDYIKPTKNRIKSIVKKKQDDELLA